MHPVSATLKARTDDLHDRAEARVLAGALVDGTAPQACVARLLRSMAPLYRALDAALLERPTWSEALGAAVVGRADAIDADAALWSRAPGGRDAVGSAPYGPPPAAASDWLQHLATLGTTWPTGLLAHVWVRFLGDLAGGRAITRGLASGRSLLRARAAAGRSDGGLALYALPDERPAAAVRAAFHEGLATLVPPHDAERLAGEARLAFQWSAELLEDAAPTAAWLAAQRQLEAYNDHDVDAFCAAYTDDVQVVKLPDAEPSTVGLPAFRAGYAALFERVPDRHAHVTARHAVGGFAVDHEVVTGGAGPASEAVATYRIDEATGRIAKVWFVL